MRFKRCLDPRCPGLSIRAPSSSASWGGRGRGRGRGQEHRDGSTSRRPADHGPRVSGRQACFALVDLPSLFCFLSLPLRYRSSLLSSSSLLSRSPRPFSLAFCFQTKRQEGFVTPSPSLPSPSLSPGLFPSSPPLFERGEKKRERRRDNEGWEYRWSDSVKQRKEGRGTREQRGRERAGRTEGRGREGRERREEGGHITRGDPGRGQLG